MRLLLVEDDAELSSRLKALLSAQSYVVDVIDNGIDAEHLGIEEGYDLIILDLGLPMRSGMDVLKNWRETGIDSPILILSARDAWHEKVDGFKAGADDYLGKPFHFEELLERTKALLRRNHPEIKGGLEFGHFMLDEEKQKLIDEKSGEHFLLTAIEFRMLRYFIINQGILLSKSRLMEHIYEYDDDKDSNVMEVYVNRLRKLIGKDRIKTRRGQGYVFTGEE